MWTYYSSDCGLYWTDKFSVARNIMSIKNFKLKVLVLLKAVLYKETRVKSWVQVVDHFLCSANLLPVHVSSFPHFNDDEGVYDNVIISQAGAWDKQLKIFRQVV